MAAVAPVADPQHNHVAASPPVREPVAYAPPPAPAEPQAVEPPAPVTAPQATQATQATQAPAPVAQPPVARPPAAEPPASEPPTTEPPAAGRAGRAARTVRAVASTKEYHRPDCEMLTGAEAEEITKVAAIRQGYLACGICKP